MNGHGSWRSVTQGLRTVRATYSLEELLILAAEVFQAAVVRQRLQHLRRRCQ